MEADEVRLDIKGQHGQIDPRAVADGINSLVGLLEHLQLPLGEPRPELHLSDLKIGSARIDIRASVSAVTIASDGMLALTDGPGMPEGWTPEALRYMVKLGEVRRRAGVEDILVSLDAVSRTIDKVLIENAQESLAPWPASLGSVQGRLFRYNDDKREAGIVDEVTGEKVKVTVPAEYADMVVAEMLKDVCVWGEIHHTPTGRIDRIIAEGIERLPDPAPPAPISELADILGSDFTGGVDAVEWVRRQRG